MAQVGLSLQQSGFEPRPFPVDFVEGKVVLGLRLHMSAAFDQCSILLFIFKASINRRNG
jgi:hypothetical protein